MSLKLTEKQQRFCDQYLIDLNATQAAIRAGYSAKTACKIGHKILLLPHVQGYLSGKRQEIQEKTNITLERTLQEIARLAFLKPKNFYREDGITLKPVCELDDDTAACLTGMEIEDILEGRGQNKVKVGTLVKIKYTEKAKALDMLMRHLGGYETDNKQKEAAVVVPLNDEQVDRIIKKMNGTAPTSSKQVRQAG